MKKNHNLSKKERQRRREKIFFGALFGALILVAVLAVIELVMPEEEGMQYLVTGDGHVHTMDGQHVGSVDEFFGEGGRQSCRHRGWSCAYCRRRACGQYRAGDGSTGGGWRRGYFGISRIPAGKMTGTAEQFAVPAFA